MSPRKTIIGMVLYPNTTQLDLTAPYEVFSRIPDVEMHVVSNTIASVKTDRGLTIVPDTTYDTCPSLDVLFIPGGPGQIKAQDDKALMDFIGKYGNKKDCLISSVCTGALLLGAAGLLRGKKATTHWTCLDVLPYMGAVAVDTPVVEDGNVITGAGVTNGIDLALRIAENLCGKDATQRIARFIEYPHASAHPDRVALERLSKEMLAQNPYRQARIEAAERTAKQLGISVIQKAS